MPPRQLGVVRGQHRAYRAGSRFPLVRCVVLKPGHNYEAAILVRVLEGPEVGEERWVKRPKVPCLWDDLDAYLETHPDVPREYVPPGRQEPEVRVEVEPPLPIGVASMRKIIREELQAGLGLTKLAYTYSEASRATGLSSSLLRVAVANGELIVSYFNSKPVFREEELRRWLENLPDEPH